MRILLILFTVVICSSCDPGVYYERIIENNSSQDIWIKATDHTFPGFTQDSFLVMSNSEQIITIQSHLGQTFQYEDCGMADSVLIAHVEGSDSLKVIKDLNTAYSWCFSILDKSFKQGGHCECRLELTDDDIE